MIELKIEPIQKPNEHWIASNHHYVREETLKYFINLKNINSWKIISFKESKHLITDLSSASHMLMLLVTKWTTSKYVLGWMPLNI